MEEKELEYVGFWTRLGATFIDSILIAVIILPMLIAFYGTAYLDSEALVEGPVDFILSYIFPTAATIIFWFFKQATPGKMAFSARIVDEKTGKTPSTGQYIGRYLAYILSTIPLFLGFIWIAFDSKKQGWHDKLAGTVVVRPKKRETEVKFDS